MTTGSQLVSSDPTDDPSDASVARVTERLRLPLLRERLERIDGRKRSRWLDFGGVQPSLVQRLSTGPHRLRVVDLGRDPRPEDVTGSILPKSGSDLDDEAFDVVLAWDWLNHFDAAGLTRLGTRVARHADPGAELHALIHYASSAMPARPVDYRLIEEGEVEFLPWTAGPAPAPRYSPKALEKAMPDWQVDRTLLLNNGMQEFILRRRAGTGDD